MSKLILIILISTLFISCKEKDPCESDSFNVEKCYFKTQKLYSESKNAAANLTRAQMIGLMCVKNEYWRACVFSYSIMKEAGEAGGARQFAAKAVVNANRECKNGDKEVCKELETLISVFRSAGDL